MILRSWFGDKEKKSQAVTASVILLLTGVLGVISAFVIMPKDMARKEESEARRLATEAALKAIEGKPFFEIEGITPDGKEARLSDYMEEGKYMLLDFWASWCGPCKIYLPRVKSVYEEYRDKGLKVVGINCWDEKDKAIKEYKKGDMPWDVIITEGKEAVSAYEFDGIPSCFLISPQGTILAAGFHPNELTDILKEHFVNE